MTSDTLPRSETRVPIALRIAAVLLFLIGAVTTVGAIVFYVPGTLLATATLVTLLVGAMALIATAAQLHRGQRPVWNLARTLVTAHLVWTIYKVFPYGETESFPFLIAGSLALSLLHLPSTRRYVASRNA